MIANKKLGTEKLSEFFGQFSVLVDSGISAPKALEILRTDDRDKNFCMACSKVEKGMIAGKTIADSMEETGQFPDVSVEMIRAAEMGGHLEKTTMRLSDHYEKEHRISEKIRGAVMYPKILVLMMIFLILFVFLAILPTLEPLLEGVRLPFLTKVLMETSRMLYRYRYFIPVAAGILFGFWKMLLTRSWFRYGYDRMICSLPVVGRQIRIICTARFCENMASLYSSGLLIPVCLKYTAGTIGNSYLDREIQSIESRVKQGKLLSEAIRESSGFEKKLAAVIVTGEESGRLDVMMERLAASYEREADLAITKLLDMLEPAMILVIGILTGLLLLGIMQPMWNMYGMIK